MLTMTMRTCVYECVRACTVRGSYRWVLGAAGEGNAALFPTGIPVGTVKIDVEVPVVGSERTAALPLEPGREDKHVKASYWNSRFPLFVDRNEIRPFAKGNIRNQ